MRLVHAALAATTAVLFGCQPIAGLTLDSPTPTPTPTTAVLATTTTATPSTAQVTSTAGADTAAGFNKTCARSVYSRAFHGAVSNGELRSALRSYRSVGGGPPHTWRGNLCTVTLAASLADDYLAYLAGVPSRYASATDYLRGVHTDCGGPVFQVSVRPLCMQRSLTAVFTTAAGGGGGGGGPRTTVLPGVPPSNGVSIDVKTGNVSLINLAANEEDSRAPRRGVVVGYAAVVAAVVGAVLVL